MPFFGHNPLHVLHSFRGERVMDCVLNLVIPIHPNLESIRNEYYLL